MLRIIAGAAKGRRLRTPASGTRPLTGRAREALFSSIADRVVGAVVLDLYAGSGSLGLEALSRGAATARFVERDRATARLLADNVEVVGLGGDVVVGDAGRFVATDLAEYDLVFVDPPYAVEAGAVDAVLEAAAARLAPGGLLVVHRRHGDAAPSVDILSEADRRRYGDATLYLFHREVLN